MVRYAEARLAPFYDATERFVAEALRHDGSLFTPGVPIWSADNIQELYHRFVEQPDTGPDPFEIKLQHQIQGAPAMVIQLAAEVLFVHLLIVHPATMGAAAKRNLINRILSWCAGEITIPPDVDKALGAGTAKPGTYFQTRRDTQVSVLLEFARKWKNLPLSEREEALTDPWKFKALVESMGVKMSTPQITVLLYMVFPDDFEDILSRDHRQGIAKHFASQISASAGDLDRQLLAIREALSTQYGTGFSFYNPQVKDLWSPTHDPWDAFIGWGKRFFASEGLEANERTYKLQVAANLKAAKDALLADSDEWPELLRKAFGKPNNLTPWQMDDNFRKWVAANRDAARSALSKFWGGNGEVSERIRVFLAEVPKQAYNGMGAVICSFLLMGEDPLRYPIFRRTVFEKGYELTGYPMTPKGADSATFYEHALDFLDRVISEAEKRGLHLRDRLDAQVLVQCLAKYTPEYEPVKSWPVQDQQAFMDYKGGFVDDDGDGGGDEDGGNGPDVLDALADKLFFDRAYLQRIEKLLEDKGQVVFYGPPGTGKTYVAQRLAEYYARDGGTVEMVQFHPSYDYEDFVEGYRPSEGGQGFGLIAGPLKRIADAARKSPDAMHVLVIDEINRGNVAKVFGELYFLLEYRDKGVTLQYSPAGEILSA